MFLEGYKMVGYLCIECHKEIKSENIRKRVRCSFCGSKILFKPRSVSVTVEAI